MASEIKTNKLDTYNASKVELVTKLDIVSGGSIDTQSGAGAVDFGNASSVSFANNAIAGGAIAAGSAECSLASGTAVKLAPTSTGVVVTGTITGATTINATTDVQLNGVGLKLYDPYAWGAFTFTVAVSTNVPTIATLAEKTTGSSAGFNISTSAAATRKLTLYYTSALSSSRGTKAMVNIQLNGLVGKAKLLDYTITRATDRIEIDFLNPQSGIADIGATAIEGNIIVMVPTS
jgi:hypothetical protein